jgi:pyrimidine-nucleoside phosphorylase
MNMNDIIYKKRVGQELSKLEIQFFIQGYTKGEIPDYQASALLMAIMFQKLSEAETINLTESMKSSGDIIDLSAIHGIKVDKHSTGGVGDKTTLVVGPIAAACGVPIAKMSGRGLGFTGGTVDKMESIPGMRTSMESDDFIKQVNEIGLAVIGQTGHIAPADKKLYALRDVTATIDNLSLISASIMSKKLAAGADAILLDVKCGSGAFMKNKHDAVDLARMMVSIGNGSGKRTVAAVTDMSQPLGMAVGNALEVIEAIHTLKGSGPEDITRLSLELAGIMVYLGKKADSPEQGKEKAIAAVQSGLALKKFEEFVEYQGGNPKITIDEHLFPQPEHKLELMAQRNGYISSIDANIIGLASQHTGAGRTVMGETIDMSAGMILHKKVGDKVVSGDVLATLFGKVEPKLQMGHAECQKAFEIADRVPQKQMLIQEIIGLTDTRNE